MSLYCLLCSCQNRRESVFCLKCGHVLQKEIISHHPRPKETLSSVQEIHDMSFVAMRNMNIPPLRGTTQSVCNANNSAATAIDLTKDFVYNYTKRVHIDLTKDDEIKESKPRQTIPALSITTIHKSAQKTSNKLISSSDDPICQYPSYRVPSPPPAPINGAALNDDIDHRIYHRMEQNVSPPIITNDNMYTINGYGPSHGLDHTFMNRFSPY